MEHTLSGKVFAPSSLNGSLIRRFSPVLRATLIVIGVSGDGAGLVLDILADVPEAIDLVMDDEERCTSYR